MAKNLTGIHLAIYNLRAREGITQRELSARSGVAQSSISQWENGMGDPTYSTCTRIANGLGISMYDLIGATNAKSPINNAGETRHRST